VWLSCWLVGPSMVSNTKSHHWSIEAYSQNSYPTWPFGSKLF
jgi:hypothetical protein